MRTEAPVVLILQDRPIGLEMLQDDLRRVQLFPLFTYAANAKEFEEHLERRTPHVILLVHRHFELSFDDVVHKMRLAGHDIPVIVILPSGEDILGMDFLRRGAQDFLQESELGRLPAAIYLAMRDHPAAKPAKKKKKEEAPSKITFEPTNGRAHTKGTADGLIENLIDIVTELDVVGNILYESPSVTGVLGYTQEEIVGRNAFSLIHPLDVPRVMPIFMVALANPGIPHSARFRFKHRNGTWRMLESVGKSITKDEGRHIVVISRDITDIRRERPALGESEARFMAVVEGLGEGLLITDTSDRILYANQQMGEFTGYDVAELLGKQSYKLFLPEEAWPIYMQQKEKWLLGNKEEYEIAMPTKDGAQLCMHVNISPYRNNEGHIVGTLAAFIDITNRKHAEEEVQRAFEHLKIEKERAEEMNRLKTSFLSNVGHEVRTPLNSILGFSNILSESLVGTEFAEYASLIETSGKRLFETIEGILDLSRVESNTVVLSPSLVSVEAEVKRIASLHDLQAREKGLSIAVECKKPIDAFVDTHYLGRVLHNLLSNAIKFTHEGSIQILIEEKEGVAEIKIVDTGIGISEEFLPHLFEEFYQESSGIARKYEGTGLGLRVAKRLLELMGATIAVESTKGKGSSFTIDLPLNLEASFTAGPV